MKPIIRVENLSKQYRIGAKQASYATLRDSLTNALAAPFHRFRNNPQSAIRNPQSDTIWALKDVSFEVHPGEVVGVIGHNGAGKSTLLKLLSRITEPSDGTIDLYGRVGSLLEVGTGFHAELTGRENIYLNGAILGMGRKEITRQFDEIVAFADLDEFIDTPVKRYSSGMYMRLAFSVAAHLQSDILIVDEVLAVGDLAFQRKCMEKMGEMPETGRTVLFVSHNMAAIQNLCTRAMLLNSGKIQAQGNSSEIISEYLQRFSPISNSGSLASLRRAPGLLPVIQRIEFLDQLGNPVVALPTGNPLTVRIYYKHTKNIQNPAFGLVFETEMGVQVFWANTRFQKGTVPNLPPSGSIICRFPKIPLTPGTYYITSGCSTGSQQLDIITRAYRLQISEADVFGTGRLPDSSKVPSLVLVNADWQFE